MRRLMILKRHVWLRVSTQVDRAQTISSKRKRKTFLIGQNIVKIPDFSGARRIRWVTSRREADCISTVISTRFQFKCDLRHEIPSRTTCIAHISPTASVKIYLKPSAHLSYLPHTFRPIPPSPPSDSGRNSQQDLFMILSPRDSAYFLPNLFFILSLQFCCAYLIVHMVFPGFFFVIIPPSSRTTINHQSYRRL